MKKKLTTITITYEGKFDPETRDLIHDQIINIIEDFDGIVLSLTIEQ